MCCIAIDKNPSIPIVVEAHHQPSSTHTIRAVYYVKIIQSYKLFLQFLCYVHLFLCEVTSMLLKNVFKKCYPVENGDIRRKICKSCLRKLDAKVSVYFGG